MGPNVWQTTGEMLRVGGGNLVSSFAYREFRWYWLGNTLAHITFLLQGVVLGWLVLIITDSPAWVGMVAFAYGIPLLIVSPLAGMLADRFNRQWVITTSLGAAALASAGLAYFGAHDAVAPGYILICSLVLGSAFSIYAPARMAILPQIVPDNMVFNATTLSYSGTRLMGFFGPVLAGLLLDMTSTFTTLLVQAALFGAATWFYWQATTKLPKPTGSDIPASGMLRGVWDAVVYLRSDPPLMALMLLGLVFIPIGMPYLKLMPVFVRDVLKAGPSVLGLMAGTASLGAALSGMAIAAIGEVYRKGYAILICSLIFGLGLMLFVFTRNELLALSLTLATGIFSGVYLTLSNVLLLSRTPDALRGRMMGFWGMVWGVQPFTTLLGGAAAERWGIVAVLVTSGSTLTLICVLMLVRRSHLLALA